jgi:hypothetical protein
LRSLIGQSFRDWVCEVHNDDPTDPVPGRIVAEAGDSRVTMAHHPSNLGPTKVFNIMYRSCALERYVSLLEDDNWWGSKFLEVMVREMDRRPTVEVGWSNMRLWQETGDGEWQDTGTNFWSVTTGESEPILIGWPHPVYLDCKFLHSQGAMLVRNERLEELMVPDDVPCNYVEPMRERKFRFPIMLLPEPLANFALTIATARESNRLRWKQYQALLLTSYLRYVRLSPDECRRLWADARSAFRPNTYGFITAGLIDGRCRYILRYSRLIDWLRYAKGFIRRPIESLRLLRAKSLLPHIWDFLDRATNERTLERNSAQTVKGLTHCWYRIPSPSAP